VRRKQFLREKSVGGTGILPVLSQRCVLTLPILNGGFGSKHWQDASATQATYQSHILRPHLPRIGVTPFFKMMLPYLAVSPVITTA
jgi:hypothetical protein